MKIWLDDIKPAPNGYIHCHSVNEAIELIKNAKEPIEQLDLDHDLGDYAFDGGVQEVLPCPFLLFFTVPMTCTS